MDCLKFPISFDSTGITKIPEGSDDYYKQLLSICARTEPGVSPLFPDFGVFDPTLMIADKGQFMVNAARYVPEVQIGQIETLIDNTGDASISITFSRRS